ncbi:hypothetical protein PTKIN_Ptkin14bG0149100 [Pterospermum kingtungense]
MASSALSSAISTIGNVLTEEAKFLWGVEEQVERLQTELRWMKSFLSLKDADARQGEDERIQMWVSEIKELAYDAEDLVEAFALRIGPKRKGDFWNVTKRWACIPKEGWLLHKTRSKIESIIARIADLTRRLQTYGIRELRDAQTSSSSNLRRELRWTYPHVVEDNIVGLSNEIVKLVSILVDHDNDHYKVVSICGMGGLGKTTLAKIVYNHNQVRGNFTHLAWVYVSQQCQKRKVWEDVLLGLNDPLIDVRKMSDEELAGKLFNFLKDTECLVILDDIWSIEDWEVIRPGFPASEPQSKSKILITSRKKQIALRGDYVHGLECLNQKDSWELFQKIAFKNRNSADHNTADGRKEKEELGKKMVEQYCAGLPLAIILLGGILASKELFNEWQRVYENVMLYLKRGKGPQGIEEVLALSYDDLPSYLRPCFLYLSQYPEDYEIDAQRLIQLWVAEGIVSSKQEHGNGDEIMEDVAEGYLIELVERCMLQAKQENFLFIVDQKNACSLSTIGKVRRVSAHVFFWIQRIKCPSIRSLLFFNMFFPHEELDKVMIQVVPDCTRNLEHRCCWDPLFLIFFIPLITCMQLSKTRGIWTYIFKNFKLLRVLDFEGRGDFSGYKLPSGIGNLIHLRFLSLRGLKFKWSHLPSSLGNLRCLQTLDLRVDGTVHVPNVIWRMEQLRHLYLPEECKCRRKLKLGTLKNLQTLANFSTKSCYGEDLLKMTNLRELKIRLPFNIEDFMEDFGENTPIIGSKRLQSITIFNHGERIDLRHLAHLLSSCVNTCKLNLEVEVSKLPEYHHFSLNIAYICLSGCKLDEDPMSTLGKLPNLKILELNYESFKGKKMGCLAQHFLKLDSLSLSGLHSLEEWKVEKGAMPALCHLKIQNCFHLKMLPDGLRFITTLQELRIVSMPNAFKDKVAEGGEDFYKVRHVPSIIFQKCF